MAVVIPFRSRGCPRQRAVIEKALTYIKAPHPLWLIIPSNSCVAAILQAAQENGDESAGYSWFVITPGLALSLREAIKQPH